MTQFNISATIDTVCPWCYVGKRKLEAGIQQYQEKHPDSGDTFVTTYAPFQLNSQSPKDPGVDKREYLAQRFGSDRVAAMEARLSQIGQSVGINFRFGGNTGNTLDSHRLIYLAKQEAGIDVHNKVVDEVERSYFENEGNITSHSMLIAAAMKAGLDEDRVKNWLGSGTGSEEVDRELKATHMRGITGVPNFVLQGKYELGGAQDPHAFVGIFENIKALESK